MKGVCCFLKNPIFQYLTFKTILAITINASYLVLGVLLSFSSTTHYGGTIQAETEQWGKGAIIDIQTTSKIFCPKGYEVQWGTFFGTQGICYKYDSTYHNGECSNNEKGSSISGLDLSFMSRFDGVKICVKRSKSDFHSIIKSRYNGT